MNKLISLRLSEDIVEKARFIAAKRGMKYQTIIKLFLADKVEEEMKKIEIEKGPSPATPYFLWDEKITEEKLIEVLKHGTPHEKYHYISKIMREASYKDVWKYLSVREIVESWDLLRNRLGKKRNFWGFMLENWRKHGFITKENFDPSAK